MDRKAKKRLDVVRPKLQQLHKQLKGARAQMDDPEEVERLEKEIRTLEAEVEELKSS